jgi:hypothetical protein
MSSSSSKKASATSRTGKRPSRKPPDEIPTLCRVPDCGRPDYTRELCQTHHRQMLTTGTVKPIRPYRKRTAGTVKFAGLRLTPQCAQRISQYAEREVVSLGAAIAFILEDWLLKQK